MFQTEFFRSLLARERPPYFGMLEFERTSTSGALSFFRIHVELTGNPRIELMNLLCANFRGTMKGKLQVVKTEAPKRVATSDEVLRAIDALSDAESERSEQFAMNRIHRIGRAAAGRDHGDLMQDAVTSLINGTRRWYPDGGVSFADCLIGAVRSLSSAWAGHRKRNADSPHYAGLDSELSFETDEGHLASLFETIASPVLNAEESAVENAVRATEIAEAKKLADAILESFSDDEPATYVLMGFEDGLSGPEIRAALNMSEPQYRTVTRKIQRRAKKIMDEFYAR